MIYARYVAGAWAREPGAWAIGHGPRVRKMEAISLIAPMVLAVYAPETSSHQPCAMDYRHRLVAVG